MSSSCATEQPISITFTYCLRDHLRSLRLFWKNSFARKIEVLAAFVMLSIAFFGFSMNRPLLGLFGVMLAAVFAFNLAGAVMITISYLLNRRQARTPYEVIADREGMRVLAGGEESRLPWTLYQSLDENKHIFLLQGKENNALIPKRVFSNPEDIARFRRLATQYQD